MKLTLRAKVRTAAISDYEQEPCTIPNLSSYARTAGVVQDIFEQTWPSLRKDVVGMLEGLPDSLYSKRYWETSPHTRRPKNPKEWIEDITPISTVCEIIDKLYERRDNSKILGLLQFLDHSNEPCPKYNFWRFYLPNKILDVMEEKYGFKFTWEKNYWQYETDPDEAYEYDEEG